MIYIYNPTCEMAVRQASATYQPPKQLAKFEADLAEIMMFIAHDGDHVVAEQPDNDLLALWQKNKTKLHFCSASDAKKLIINGEQLKPWGECAQVFHAFGDSTNYKSFDDAKRKLHSRISSIELEKTLTDSLLPRYAQHAPTSHAVCSVEEAKTLIARGNCVVKSLWSSSGRGVVIVSERQHVTNATLWALDKIKNDGTVIVETLLDRKCEFSFLFDIAASGNVKYLGINYFEADIHGRFGNELIGYNPMSELGFATNWDLPIAEQLAISIKKITQSSNYSGFVGVDSMAYSDNGTIRIRPCVEINMRTCMGNININVSKHFAVGTKAKWHIDHYANADEWNTFCNENGKRYPLIFNNNGEIISGFYRLTSLGGKKNFGVWGIAGN